MRRFAQRAIFTVFVASFAVAAPATVLWTAGYRYSLTRNRLEKTGILQVASIPKKAAIAVDGKTLTDLETPAIVPALLPDTYRVTVSKPGYLPWSKRLAVESGKSTFAEHMVLFRDDAPRLMTPGTFVAAAWDAAAERMAAIADAGEWWELVTIDADGRHLAGRLGKDAFHPAKSGAADISPSGAFAAFSGSDKLGKGVVFVGSATTARDGTLSAFRQLSDIRAVRWIGDDGVLTISGEGISLLDPDAAFTTAAVSDGLYDDARWDGSGVVAVRKDDGRATLLRSRGDLLAFEPALGLSGTNAYAIIAARRSQVLVRDTGSGEGVLVDLLTGAQRRLDATSAEWGVGAAEGKLLACTGVEVAVVDLVTGNRQVVTRQGGAINDCRWHPSGSYIFYRAGTTAYVIENDTRDVPVSYVLFSGASLSGFSVTPKAKAAVFMGTMDGTGGVWRRELE